MVRISVIMTSYPKIPITLLERIEELCTNNKPVKGFIQKESESTD